MRQAMVLYAAAAGTDMQAAACRALIISRLSHGFKTTVNVVKLTSSSSSRHS